jgi:peptidyl-prolyl cis-trans isomerase A (cyclophilin A)
MISVLLSTELGEIELSLDEKRAPNTVKNFLRYVSAKAYDNGSFYRTVTTRPDNQPDKSIKIDVIQGGAVDNFKDFAPIALERTNTTKLRHLDGTLSMARDTPDSATNAFFICVGNQPELDFGGKRNPDGQGFAAFGQVIRGMEVVRKIQRSKADGQTLTPKITIRTARQKITARQKNK